MFCLRRILIVRWKQHSRRQCSLNDFQMRSLTLKQQLERKALLIFKKWSPSLSVFPIIPSLKRPFHNWAVVKVFRRRKEWKEEREERTIKVDGKSLLCFNICAIRIPAWKKLWSQEGGKCLWVKAGREGEKEREDIQRD